MDEEYEQEWNPEDLGKSIRHLTDSIESFNKVVSKELKQSDRALEYLKEVNRLRCEALTLSLKLLSI